MNIHVCDLIRFVRENDSSRAIEYPFQTKGVLSLNADKEQDKISLRGDTLYLRSILEGDLNAGLPDEGKYVVDPEQEEKLFKLLSGIAKFNKMYKTKTKLQVCKPASERYGILQVDIPYEPSPWIHELLDHDAEWNPLENPGVYEHGVRFGDSGTSMRVLNETLAECFAHPSGKWRKVFPRQLYINEEGNLINGWQDFLTGQFQTGVLFIEEDERHYAHTVYLWKDGSTITLYDPRGLSKGQESLRILEDRLEDRHLDFHWTQKLEQGKEGSCGYFSVARALLLSEHGTESLDKPIPHDYLYLVGRMIKSKK